MPNLKALAGFILALLAWCLWPFAAVAASVVGVVSVGLALWTYRAGRRRLALGIVGCNACGAAMAFLVLVPAVQHVQEATRRTTVV